MKIKDIVREEAPVPGQAPQPNPSGQPQMGKVSKVQPGVGGAPGMVSITKSDGSILTVPSNQITTGTDGKMSVNTQQDPAGQNGAAQPAPTANGQPTVTMGQDLQMAEEGDTQIKDVLAQQKVPYYVDMTTGMVNAGGTGSLKIRVDPALDQGPDRGEGSSPVVLQSKQGGQKVIGYMGASGIRLSQASMQQLSSPAPATTAPAKSPGMLDRIKSLAGL